MENEPSWLSADDVAEINIREVASTGESYFLRDENLLNSAAAKPLMSFHYGGESDLGVLSVILMFGIIRNHPFEQGNKRTGFHAAVKFLQLNGWDCVLRDDRYLSQAIIDVLEGKKEEDDFTYTFSRSIVRINFE